MCQEFYGPGVKALLLSDGWQLQCFVVVDRQDSPKDHVPFQMLVQPTDRRGLPSGGPVVLASGEIPLRVAPLGDQLLGQVWLPGGITPEIVEKCYLRLGAIP